MRPYVNEVKSNIKTGVSAKLGRKTLVIGPNGSGKSAITNAIEAAGSARVSDVAGRAVLAKGAELSMLASADKVWANAHLSDDTSPDFTVERGHNPKRLGPEIAFPLRAVREAILGSPETARKWILEQAGEVKWEEVTALVPVSLHDRLRSTPTVGKGDSAADLVLALEHARKRVREAGASAKAARSVSAPPGPPPTDDEVAKLEAIVRGWEARGAGGAVDSVREALKGARENVDRLSSAIKAIEAELSGLQNLAPTSRLREAAVEVAEWMAGAKVTTCALCSGKCNPVEIASRAAAGRAKIKGDSDKAKRRLDLEFALREANLDLGAARREVTRLEGEETKLVRLGKDSTALGEPLPIDEATAKAQLSALRDRRAGWAASRRMEEQALTAEREAAEWGQLAEALSKAMGVLVEKGRVAFEEKVQRYLPAGDRFGVDLLDGDREVLRVGLRVDTGPVRAALSGAEWARVTAALALATAPAAGPCVVAPEERAFDPAMLTAVLEAWDGAVTGDDAPQIVMTSPIEPTRIPVGWTVIRTGEAALTPGFPRGLPINAPLEGPAIGELPKSVEARERDLLAPEQPKKRRGRPPKVKVVNATGSPVAVNGEVIPSNTTPLPEVVEFIPSKVNEDGTKSLVEVKKEAPKDFSDIFGE